MQQSTSASCSCAVSAGIERQIATMRKRIVSPALSSSLSERRLPHSRPSAKSCGSYCGLDERRTIASLELPRRRRKRQTRKCAESSRWLTVPAEPSTPCRSSVRLRNPEHLLSGEQAADGRPQRLPKVWLQSLSSTHSLVEALYLTNVNLVRRDRFGENPRSPVMPLKPLVLLNSFCSATGAVQLPLATTCASIMMLS